MTHEQYRYFIELQPQTNAGTPRRRESELRRTMADEFIRSLREWLGQNCLTAKVSGLSITAFGQVLITCETDVIQMIRDQDIMDIAAIRPSATLGESLARLSENKLHQRAS